MNPSPSSPATAPSITIRPFHPSPLPDLSLINRHLRRRKGTGAIISSVLYYVGSICLEEDCKMRSTTHVGERCDAEMSAWYAHDTRNRPLVIAGAAILGGRDGGVLGGPRYVVAADGLVAVLEAEVVGIAEGGGGMDASDRHGCC